jgi:hypothetical protein
MSRRHFFVSCALAILLGGVGQAAAAADATGIWKWKVTGQNDREVELTLDLKQEGEKLSGTITRGSAGRNIDIAKGVIQGDEMSFETTIERNGNMVTNKYKGKLAGDTIKGTIERGRQNRARDWLAKREKPSA